MGCHKAFYLFVWRSKGFLPSFIFRLILADVGLVETITLLISDISSLGNTAFNPSVTNYQHRKLLFLTARAQKNITTTINDEKSLNAEKEESIKTRAVPCLDPM